MNNRPFRSLNAKQLKNTVYRITGLRCVSSATANLFVDGLTTSSLYTATPYHSKGAVIPLPLDHSKYTNPVSPPVVFAHPGQDLNDLAFSPHAPNVLATVSGDTIRVFELPQSGVLEQSFGQATVELTGLNGATSLAWHPTCRGLVAVGLKDGFAIVNVDYDTFGNSPSVPTSALTGRAILKILTNQGPGKEIARISWSYNGQYVTAIGKDGGFYVVDPRTVTDFETPIKSFTEVLGLMKTPHFATFIGKDGYSTLFVAGLGTARKPCYRVVSFDAAANTMTSVLTGDLTCSSGQLLAHYDYDTQLVFLATRSAQSGLVFDTSLVSVPKPNAALFTPLISIPFGAGTKGMSPVPKSKVSIDDSEVINFYSHTGENVELYSISVIRKDRGYHAELYPDTFAGQAALSFDEYMEKKNVNPPTKSLNPYNFNTTTAASTPATPAHGATATSPSSSASASASAVAAPECALASAAAPEPQISNAQLFATQEGFDKNVRSTLDSKFQRTTFLHCTGVEPGLNKDIYTAYDLRSPKQHLSYGKTLVANNTMFATPYQSAGGSIVYVRLLSTTGRAPVTQVTGVTGPSPISALSISQFNQYQLATASEDGFIRVYNLPSSWTSGELPQNVNTAAFEFNLGVRIQVLQYHSYIENCLLATGYDAGLMREVLFIFDITPGTEGEQRYQAYPQVINDRSCHIDFSPDGCHVAIANKKSEIVIVSMPGGTPKLTITHGSTPKESWGLWYDKDHIVTIGFAHGARSVQLHKIDWAANKSTLIKSETFSNQYLLIPHLDITTGFLILGALGTRNMNTFYINPNQAPYVDSLNVFAGRNDVVGVAFLPKVHVNVNDVEIVRSIKLNQNSEVWPVSWQLPRKRKEYFQDDIYTTGAPLLKSIISSADYFNSVLENAVNADPNQTKYTLTWKSLQPAGMINLSEAPEEELTERQQKYLQMKQKQFHDDKPVGFLGHKSNEEVYDHYLKKAERVGVDSRYTARTDHELNDVSDSEWD